MKREEAVMGIGYLVAATQGWNDEAVTVYVDQCMRFNDPNAFVAAMRNLSLHWRGPGRPMMFDVNVAYQTEVRNQEMARAMIPETTGPILALEEGVEVARRAYHEECRRQGRTGTDDIFDSWVQTITNKRLQRAERGEREVEDDF